MTEPSLFRSFMITVADCRITVAVSSARIWLSRSLTARSHILLRRMGGVWMGSHPDLFLLPQHPRALGPRRRREHEKQYGRDDNHDGGATLTLAHSRGRWRATRG